jgi:hypothetical protein
MPSDIGQIMFGPDQQDYKRLFRSPREIALLREVTLQGGYGVLPMGTLLALNKSAAGNVGKCVPYNPTVPSSGDKNQKGRAFLVADAAGSGILYVSMKDSYKFAVGDDVIIGDANTTTTSTENLGAITAIDRTTYQHMAKITTTSSESGGTFTVAQSAYISVEAGADNTNNYSDCVGILDQSVDTGEEEEAAGALATMVVKNAILYQDALVNYDAAAATDLGASAANRLVTI